MMNLTIVISGENDRFGMVVDLAPVWQKRNPIRSILRMT
jgi:hypothetical protein